MTFKIDASPTEQLRFAMSDGLDAAMLTTAAVLKDNHVGVAPDAIPYWTTIAQNIIYLMTQNDEARFTLYDYLDAIINSREPNQIEERLLQMPQEPTPWNKSIQEPLFNELIEMAAQKRRTYSDEF